MIMELKSSDSRVVIVKVVPRNTQNDGCVDKDVNFGGDFTKEYFESEWSKTTELFKTMRREKEERDKDRLRIAKDGMKPDMLKTASGVTYLGNGKVVKYV